MKKTLYSMLLDEDVIHAVDRMAHRSGVSRSALVNRILAEYVDLQTPESRIGDILRAIQTLVEDHTELVPFIAPGGMTMSLKSALDYKYRPTVRYEVELYRGSGDEIGKLSVVFRTQSAALLEEMGKFFRLWRLLELRYLQPRLGREAPCALYDGRFVRAIARPNRDCSSQQLADALSGYIQLFDRLLKGRLSGRFTDADVEVTYADHTAKAAILL